MLQNYILRKLRERDGGSPASPTPPAAAEAPVDVEGMLHNQPVVKAHAQRDQKPKDLDLNSVNHREVQHVVVPYTPLMYQRFYDWPPEPQFARVKKAPPQARPQQIMHAQSATKTDFPFEESVSKPHLYRVHSDGHGNKTKTDRSVLSNGGSSTTRDSTKVLDQHTAYNKKHQ